MKNNAAVQILLNLGVNPLLFLAAKRSRSVSYTKKGPGRRHQDGKPDPEPEETSEE